MGHLVESTSGLRGTKAELIDRLSYFAKAYAQFYREKGIRKVVFGRDTRPGEVEVLEVVRKIFLNEGFDFIDLGIVPTPTTQLIAQKYKILGIEGTASHNPNPDVGFKPFDLGGIITADKLKDIQELAKNPLLDYEGKKGEMLEISDLIKEDIITHNVTNNLAFDYHISRVLDSFGDETINAIKKKNYKVVVDHVMGAGYKVVPELLKYLNCEVISVYEGKPGEKFPREFPEPTPKNLLKFEELIKESGADIGFAVDPDVDRLVLGDINGCLSEEYTLAIAIKYFTEKYKSGIAVANLSASRIGEFIAKKAGWDFYRTAVGERNVLDGILKKHARIGGEGNGGVINPEIAPGRDAIYGIVLILAYMAETNQSLESIIKIIPKYFMVKEKICLDEGVDIDKAINKAKPEIYECEDNYNRLGRVLNIDNTDGLRIDFEKGWVSLRKSNTEPIVRIMTEADTQELMDYLMERTKGLFK